MRRSPNNGTGVACLLTVAQLPVAVPVLITQSHRDPYQTGRGYKSVKENTCSTEELGLGLGESTHAVSS